MNQSVASPVSATHQAETLLFFILLQLAVIVLAGRVGGESAKRLGQSVAVGEIVVGILLGPSLFGQLAPQTFQYVFRSVPPEPLHILSQIGLILLMFQIGLEFDFSHLREPVHRRVTAKVALSSLLFPLALGLSFGYYSAPTLSPEADPIASALFVGVALSITALPILGRIMIEFDMHRSSLGAIAIGAAAINDVAGWILLAVVTALTGSRFEPAGFALQIGLIALFFLACAFVVRPLLKRAIRAAGPRSDGMSNTLLGGMLAAIFLGAMTTYQLGLFAIFGGFMIGAILHDEKAFAEAWRARVGQFVAVFFLPIFFTYTGLRTFIGGLDSLADWGWCLAIVALATLGKFGGAYAAARASGLSRHEAAVLGAMMNTRALMELIVVNVGRDLGVISQNVFTMLVLMAVFSTVVTTPCLRAWLPKTRLAGQAQTHGPS